jgi:hypothetical protein
MNYMIVKQRVGDFAQFQDFFYRAFGKMTLILRGVGTKLKRSAPSEQARGQSVYADTRKRKDEAEGI